MKFDKYFEDAIELDNTPEFIAAREKAVINLNRNVPIKGTKKVFNWEEKKPNKTTLDF